MNNSSLNLPRRTSVTGNLLVAGKLDSVISKMANLNSRVDRSNMYLSQIAGQVQQQDNDKDDKDDNDQDSTTETNPLRFLAMGLLGGIKRTFYWVSGMLGKTLSGIVSGIKKTFSIIGAGFKNMFKGLLGGLKKAMGAIKGGLNKAGVFDVLGSMATFKALQMFNDPDNQNIIDGFFDFLQNGITKLWNGLTNFIEIWDSNGFISAVSDLFNLDPETEKAWREKWGTFKDWFVNKMPGQVSELIGAIDDMLPKITSLLQRVGYAAGAALEGNWEEAIKIMNGEIKVEDIEARRIWMEQANTDKDRWAKEIVTNPEYSNVFPDKQQATGVPGASISVKNTSPDIALAKVSTAKLPRMIDDQQGVVQDLTDRLSNYQGQKERNDSNEQDTPQKRLRAESIEKNITETTKKLNEERNKLTNLQKLNDDLGQTDYLKVHALQNAEAGELASKAASLAAAGVTLYLTRGRSGVYGTGAVMAATKYATMGLGTGEREELIADHIEKTKAGDASEVELTGIDSPQAVPNQNTTETNNETTKEVIATEVQKQVSNTEALTPGVERVVTVDTPKNEPNKVIIKSDTRQSEFKTFTDGLSSTTPAAKAEKEAVKKIVNPIKELMKSSGPGAILSKITKADPNALSENPMMNMMTSMTDRMTSFVGDSSTNVTVVDKSSNTTQAPPVKIETKTANRR